MHVHRAEAVRRSRLEHLISNLLQKCNKNHLCSSSFQGCFKKSFPLDHAKISKREIDVRGEIYKLV